MRATAALLIAATLAAGCAGPTAQVQIGAKSLPIDVAFGLPPATVLPANTPTTLVPVPGGIGVIPVPTSQLGGPGQVMTGPAQGPHQPPKFSSHLGCNDLPPGVFATTAATPSVIGVPRAFSYRTWFLATVVDGAVKTTIHGTGRHVVSAPTTTPAGATSFDVTVSMLGAESTFNYASVPGVNSAAGVSSGVIELRSVSGTAGLGYRARFKPANPIELFVQPAYVGATWTSAGADPDSGARAKIDGVVDKHVTVNACGTPLDAWRTTATLVTSSTDENITSTLQTDWATQYGGVPVGETETYSGTAGGHNVSGTVTWVFSGPVLDPM